MTQSYNPNHTGEDFIFGKLLDKSLDLKTNHAREYSTERENRKSDEKTKFYRNTSKSMGEYEKSSILNLSLQDVETPESSYPPLLFRSFNLAEILEIGKIDIYSDEKVLYSINDVIMSGIKTSAKDVNQGDLFISLPHQNNNNNLSTVAFARGACAVVNDVCDKDKSTWSSTDEISIAVENSFKVLGRVAASFFGNPSRRMTIIGVTGTCGKTTTSWYIRSILETMNQLTGLVGSIEYALAEHLLNEDGSFWRPTSPDPTRDRDSTSPFHLTPYPLGKYKVIRTTPGVLEVQKLMASLCDRGVNSCVLECSSIGLDEGRCSNIDFDVAVHTNLTKNHMDYHESFKNYLNSKLKLFMMLSDNFRQRAVINLDDSFAEQFAWAAEKVPIVTYSKVDSNADVYLAKAETTINESAIVVVTHINTHLKITSKIIGSLNIYSILSSIATGLAIGAPFNKILTGIEVVEIIPGRCELLKNKYDFTVLIDNANTPGELSRILDAIRDCKPARIIAVIGCCGDRQKGKRARIGEIVHHKSEIVILTNDNPGKEQPNEIITDIVAGWPDEILLKCNWYIYPWYQDIGRLPMWFNDLALWVQSETKRFIIEDRNLAIKIAIYTAQKDDVVVILGKGERDYQEWSSDKLFDKNNINIKKNPLILKSSIRGWFDDRVESRNALSKVPHINAVFPGINRSSLPWSWPGLHRKHPLEEWDCNLFQDKT
jgi:UDP-N-acetylmuramyl tripeptide synthase